MMKIGYKYDKPTVGKINIYICGYLSLDKLPIQFNTDCVIIDELCKFNQSITSAF